MVYFWTIGLWCPRSWFLFQSGCLGMQLVSAKLNLKLALRIEIPSGDTVAETPQLPQLFELANVRSPSPPENIAVCISG